MTDVDDDNSDTEHSARPDEDEADGLDSTLTQVDSPFSNSTSPGRKTSPPGLISNCDRKDDTTTRNRYELLADKNEDQQGTPGEEKKKSNENKKRISSTAASAKNSQGPE
jgi:hypothetical protein